MYKYLYKVWISEKGKKGHTFSFICVVNTTIFSQVLHTVALFYNNDKYTIADVKKIGILDGNVPEGPILKSMYPNYGILNLLVEKKAMYPITIIKSVIGHCEHRMVVFDATNNLSNDRMAVERFVREEENLSPDDIVEVSMEHRVDVDPASIPCIVGSDTVVNSRKTITDIFSESM